MSHIRVGVLRGGVSDEYDISLETGKSVLKNLPEKYKGYDIFIDKKGTWHLGGVPVNPHDVADRVDVVFNALHGKYGEDGKVQRELDLMAIPYTGSGFFSSLIAMQKVHTKEMLSKVNILSPIYDVVYKTDDIPQKIQDVFRHIPFPLVAKPVSGGSSVGVFIIKSFNELENTINKMLQNFEAVLVEQYIVGKEATCGVVDNFRSEESYVLPPVEIRTPDESTFFDYDAKYGGKSEEICPGNFTKKEKEEIMAAARLVHKELGLRHYSRSDFIVSPRGIYFLEVNTLPGLTEESLLPKSLNAVGASLPGFLDHILTLAMR